MSQTLPVDSRGAKMDKHIHESNLIEGYDDPDFDKQSMVAWEFLKEQIELLHYDLCKVQKIITLLQDDLQPDQRGYLRKVSVTVGGIQCPSPTQAALQLTQWLAALRDYKNCDPKKMHQWFEYIHPFVDGNGRTGRMLMWWHEIKLGKPPTLILNSQKQDYYKWFRKANR